VSKRTVAVRPRQQDKRDVPSPARPVKPVRRIQAFLRRYRPPAAQFGLWELPDGMGTTVLR